MITVIIGVFVIWAVWVLLWIAISLFAVRNIQEPEYALMEKKQWYEIREYAPYIVAQVEVEWEQKEAIENGFRQLAGYIFGGNTSKKKIDMTAPVQDIKHSEKISMTVPVMDYNNQDNQHTIQFTMPSEYTLETLPVPDNKNISFEHIQMTRRAVLRYTGLVSEKTIEQNKQKLHEMLKRDSIKSTWEFISAQYNPPLTFPFIKRNEILVDIQK